MHLFAYGTLRQSNVQNHAPKEVASIVERLRPVGQGHVRGQLYDLGQYPAAIFRRSSSIIEGEVYLLPNSAALKALDKYEGFYPVHPDRSLFIRKKKLITLSASGQKIFCWAYEYNRPIPT